MRALNAFLRQAQQGRIPLDRVWSGVVAFARSAAVTWPEFGHIRDFRPWTGGLLVLTLVSARMGSYHDLGTAGVRRIV